MYGVVHRTNAIDHLILAVSYNLLFLLKPFALFICAYAAKNPEMSPAKMATGDLVISWLLPSELTYFLGVNQLQDTVEPGNYLFQPALWPCTVPAFFCSARPAGCPTKEPFCTTVSGNFAYFFLWADACERMALHRGIKK